MFCSICGGENDMIIMEVGTKFPTLPRHKYNEMCIQFLVRRIAHLEEVLHIEMSFADKLVDR